MWQQGFGLYQFAWGSKKTLSAENYAKGRQKLMADERRNQSVPIGVMPKSPWLFLQRWNKKRGKW